MDLRVACPRCNQDYLLRVRLVHLGREAVLCPECDALWVSPSDVSFSTFQDYGTFMREHGRPEPEEPSEVAVLGPLLRDPDAA